MFNITKEGTPKDFNKFMRSYSPQSALTTVINDEGNYMDIYSHMLNDRIIFLKTEVDNFSANLIKSQLLYLNTLSDEDIKIYIDSPGGSVYTGLGIIDIMDYIECDIHTVNIGLAASMAAVILSNGQKGKRSSLKRSRTMIHQPLGYSGYAQASDIVINAEEIKDLKNQLVNILADRTGQSYDKVLSDSDRDYWLNSEGAKDYGIIDRII